MAEQAAVLPAVTVTATRLPPSHDQRQWLRKATLIVLPPNRATTDDPFQQPADIGIDTATMTQKGLDLSEMHFVFQVSQADEQSPNNAAIRVYNLAPQTVKKIRGEFSRVVLQAGYQNAGFGVIFDGTVMQFRVGRENATDTYLDLLCADGDFAHNRAVINQVLPPGTRLEDSMRAAAAAMNAEISHIPDLTDTNPERLARGKILFGLARDVMTDATETARARWSIQNGKVQILRLDEYLPGEAVVINALTGMIGMPEQTDGGISFRCLLNPKLRVGSLVQLNNKDINQLIKQKDALPIPFNQWTAIQFASKVVEAADGLYRLYVVEYTGDTRGVAWYSDAVCLAVDRSSEKVQAKT